MDTFVIESMPFGPMAMPAPDFLDAALVGFADGFMDQSAIDAAKADGLDVVAFRRPDGDTQYVILNNKLLMR